MNYYQPPQWRDISDMLGKTFTKVVNEDDYELKFYCDEGVFVFYHEQDCCESVYINDIVGDLQDLVGSPLLTAEKSSSSADDDVSESGTWTFYKFATIKGYVDVRWLGTSNGYYSEGVDLVFRPNT